MPAGKPIATRQGVRGRAAPQTSRCKVDLHSDHPYWTVRNGLVHVYPPLERDIRCDAAIVGGGITGAILLNAFTAAGIDCVVIDRRDVGQGSTSASTALLQYEIDTPLYELIPK